MAPDESWKEKYFQEIESADDQEQKWKAERNALTRMLVRTSLASKGQRPELDQLLDRVREDLRRKKIDPDAWRDLQEQIDFQVARLDEPSVGSGAQPSRVEPVPPSERRGVPGDSEDLANESQRLRIARRVGELLGNLLDQISLDPAAEASARGLQQALLSSDDWGELREGLNHVAELVLAAVTQSQREFEAFLKRLDE
ncbi:MAG TPA: GGDEF domain-containing protein, partial [Marinobacter sp.]|nr:GGDEF domain-containing protein [Marinobacter sp.]